ncbi:coiled-coil domain-containing protein 7 [Gracilinanus agilis]|uniref:coiled-coil domain-containing protein 7 n=1 Tax=Gracilinanus agilis TaxID=191870 RepID=UPI001CFC8DA1|nr:coiled-coil domain-containing protein 7 [Gracilinanus agilis]
MEHLEVDSKKVFPKAKKRSIPKVTQEPEPMILAPPPTGESMLKHAIAIPSENPDNVLDDEQIVRLVTKHLTQIASNLEKTYGFDIDRRWTEKAAKSEGEERTLTEAEDMSSFLRLCSAFAKQLEEAVKEEQQILDSLFTWFQEEVYHVEELVKEQNASDWEIPLPDKTVSSSIAQVIERLQRLEHLRDCLSIVPMATRRAAAAKNMQENRSHTNRIYEEVKKMIEDFAATNENDEFIEHIMDIANKVFLSENNETKDLQFQEMFKIFEKQANKLQRMMTELDNLDYKYKMIQSDLDMVTEDRMIFENELRRMKGPEKIEQLLQRERKLSDPQGLKRSERRSSKDLSKTGDPDSYGKRPSISSSEALKLKEDLYQAQKVVASLENENKFLLEQLKEALQEVEKAKKDLEAAQIQTRKSSDKVNDNSSLTKGKKGKKGKKDKKGKTN